MKEQVMATRLFVTAIIAMSLVSGPALACSGKEIFSDNFTGTGRGWQKWKGAAIGAGKAVLTPEPEKSTALVYGGELFEDADICVELTVDKPRDPQKTVGGLILWDEDWNNHALFLISPDGAATVIRYQKGKRLTPIAWEDTDLVDTKPNAVNRLRLTLKGRSQVVYINDKVFGELKMAPPADGGKFGFDAESEPDAANTWTFTKLKVTEPPR